MRPRAERPSLCPHCPYPTLPWEWSRFEEYDLVFLAATVVAANQGDVGHGAVLVHSDRTDAALAGNPWTTSSSAT